MANAPTPPTEPRTGLWALGFRFESVSRYFDEMYRDIKDIWLLGKWLAWPFYFISRRFLDARDKAWEADQTLVWVKSWVKGLVEGNSFRELIDSVSWHYRMIRNYPWLWVKDRIKEISPEARQFIDHPYQFVAEKLLAYYPIFWSIIYNPGIFIREKLYALFPFLQEFFTYPVGLVIGWVRGFWRWLDLFDRNPVGTIIDWFSLSYSWIKGFLSNPRQTVTDWVKKSSWDISLLISNPMEWFRLYLSNVLNISPGELNDLPLFFLRRILSIIRFSVGALRDELEHSICSIILDFM